MGATIDLTIFKSIIQQVDPISIIARAATPLGLKSTKNVVMNRNEYDGEDVKFWRTSATKASVTKHDQKYIKEEKFYEYTSTQ